MAGWQDQKGAYRVVPCKIIMAQEAAVHPQYVRSSRYFLDIHFGDHQSPANRL